MAPPVTGRRTCSANVLISARMSGEVGNDCSKQGACSKRIRVTSTLGQPEHADEHALAAMHAGAQPAPKHLDVQRGGLEGREAPPPHRQHELHQEAVLVAQRLPQLVL